MWFWTTQKNYYWNFIPGYEWGRIGQKRLIEILIFYCPFIRHRSIISGNWGYLGARPLKLEWPTEIFLVALRANSSLGENRVQWHQSGVSPTKGDGDSFQIPSGQKCIQIAVNPLRKYRGEAKLRTPT